MELKKKSQGISLNVIIIAAIALIVLVILILIFTGRIGLFTREVNACTNAGGTCVDLGTYNTADEACGAVFGTYAKSMAQECTKTIEGKQVADPSKVCCIRASK